MEGVTGYVKEWGLLGWFINKAAVPDSPDEIKFFFLIWSQQHFAFIIYNTYHN